MIKNHRSLSGPIIISLLLHVAVSLALVLWQYWTPPEKGFEPLEITWVQESAKPKQAKQIVQQEPTAEDKAPEKDYRLSESHRDVIEETKASHSGDFQNKDNQVKGEATQAKPQSGQQAASQRQEFFDKFKPKMFDDTYHPDKLAPESPAARSGGEISQTDDYLEDVVAGAETLLRTREFIYYGYYNRIKTRLKAHWEPRIKDKIVKILRQGRTIASVNNKITRLVITLDAHGELVRIQVKGASGYNDLDDAAIEAFRAAAPFPNPPKGLRNERGEIEINWDFVLET